MLHVKKRYTDYSSAVVLCAYGTYCNKNTPFRWVHSKELFQQLSQSAVDARKQSDENSNRNVVAETKKLPDNSSYGYQIKDRSRHTVTKHLIDKKTHVAIISELFKELVQVNNLLYEVELAKAQI